MIFVQKVKQYFDIFFCISSLLFFFFFFWSPFSHPQKFSSFLFLQTHVARKTKARQKKESRRAVSGWSRSALLSFFFLFSFARRTRREWWSSSSSESSESSSCHFSWSKTHSSTTNKRQSLEIIFSRTKFERSCPRTVVRGG